MSAERLELSTNGLKGRCSAIELRARESSEGHSNTAESERQQNLCHGFSLKNNLCESVAICG